MSHFILSLFPELLKFCCLEKLIFVYVVIFVVPVWWRFSRYRYQPPYVGPPSPSRLSIALQRPAMKKFMFC